MGRGVNKITAAQGLTRRGRGNPESRILAQRLEQWRNLQIPEVDQYLLTSFLNVQSRTEQKERIRMVAEKAIDEPAWAGERPSPFDNNKTSVFSSRVIGAWSHLTADVDVREALISKVESSLQKQSKDLIPNEEPHIYPDVNTAALRHAVVLEKDPEQNYNPDRVSQKARRALARWARSLAVYDKQTIEEIMEATWALGKTPGPGGSDYLRAIIKPLANHARRNTPFVSIVAEWNGWSEEEAETRLGCYMGTFTSADRSDGRAELFTMAHEGLSKWWLAESRKDGNAAMINRLLQRMGQSSLEQTYSPDVIKKLARKNERTTVLEVMDLMLRNKTRPSDPMAWQYVDAMIRNLDHRY